MATTPDSPAPLDQANAMARGTLIERMGIVFTEVGADRLVATMPVEGNTQPYGLLHGGASVVLAETLGSFGSVLHAGPDRVAVGIEINATHHRAARSGLVTGTATPLHLGVDHGDAGRSRSPTTRAGRCAPPGSPACSATAHRAPDGVRRDQSLTRATAARTRRSERRRASRLSVTVAAPDGASRRRRTLTGADRRTTTGPKPRRA